MTVKVSHYKKYTKHRDKDKDKEKQTYKYIRKTHKHIHNDIHNDTHKNIHKQTKKINLYIGGNIYKTPRVKHYKERARKARSYNSGNEIVGQSQSHQGSSSGKKEKRGYFYHVGKAFRKFAPPKLRRRYKEYKLNKALNKVSKVKLDKTGNKENTLTPPLTPPQSPLSNEEAKALLTKTLGGPRNNEKNEGYEEGYEKYEERKKEDVDNGYRQTKPPPQTPINKEKGIQSVSTGIRYVLPKNKGVSIGTQSELPVKNPNITLNLKRENNQNDYNRFGNSVRKNNDLKLASIGTNTRNLTTTPTTNPNIRTLGPYIAPTIIPNTKTSNNSKKLARLLTQPNVLDVIAQTTRSDPTLKIGTGTQTSTPLPLVLDNPTTSVDKQGEYILLNKNPVPDYLDPSSRQATNLDVNLQENPNYLSIKAASSRPLNRSTKPEVTDRKETSTDEFTEPNKKPVKSISQIGTDTYINLQEYINSKTNNKPILGTPSSQATYLDVNPTNYLNVSKSNPLYNVAKPTPRPKTKYLDPSVLVKQTNPDYFNTSSSKSDRPLTISSKKKNIEPEYPVYNVANPTQNKNTNNQSVIGESNPGYFTGTGKVDYAEAFLRPANKTDYFDPLSKNSEVGGVLNLTNKKRYNVAAKPEKPEYAIARISIPTITTTTTTTNTKNYSNKVAKPVANPNYLIPTKLGNTAYAEAFLRPANTTDYFDPLSQNPIVGVSNPIYTPNTGNPYSKLKRSNKGNSYSHLTTKTGIVPNTGTFNPYNYLSRNKVNVPNEEKRFLGSNFNRPQGYSVAKASIHNVEYAKASQKPVVSKEQTSLTTSLTTSTTSPIISPTPEKLPNQGAKPNYPTGNQKPVEKVNTEPGVPLRTTAIKPFIRSRTKKNPTTFAEARKAIQAKIANQEIKPKPRLPPHDLPKKLSESRVYYLNTSTTPTTPTTSISIDN